MTEELIVLKELEEEFENLKFMNRKRTIENAISNCEKQKYQTDEDYIIIDNNLNKIIINEYEFWEKWNNELEKIIDR